MRLHVEMATASWMSSCDRNSASTAVAREKTMFTKPAPCGATISSASAKSRTCSVNVRHRRMSPSGSVVATSAQVDYLTVNPASIAMNANAVTPVGGSQPHENMQPYLCVSFIISLFGLFPQQN